MANGNGGDDGIMDRILGTLENKLIMLFMAAILGISGNQILLQAKPETIRPDPFTGTMGKQLEAKLMREIDLRLRPHEEHLEHAVDGWTLIYEMRQDIALIKQKLDIQ